MTMNKSSSKNEQQKYTCDWCGKKTTIHYTFGDELLCEDCFEEQEDKAQNAYDVACEEGRI